MAEMIVSSGSQDNTDKRNICLLDVKDLLQLRPNLDYESGCPACQNPISEHSDNDFQEGQKQDNELGNAKKKQRIYPVATAAKLAKKGRLCEAMGCGMTPSFNFSDENKARFCGVHKEEGMVNIKAIFCEQNGCAKVANYNKEGEKSGVYCSSHKADGMINVKSQLCLSEGCSKIPSYNVPTESKPLFCKEHMELDMVDVKHDSCEVEGCSTRPHYNLPGLKKGRFCATHKEAGMVGREWTRKKAAKGEKVDYRKYMSVCEFEGCGIQANFNFPGLKKGRFCTTHKLEGMGNVHQRTLCEAVNCRKHPYFNFRSEKKGRFCNDHKIEDMINVYSNKCEIEGCFRGANYLMEVERRPRRCAKHKEANMKAGKKTRPVCEVDGCTKRPTFYFPETHKNAVVCLLHKSDGMVSRNSTKRKKGDEEAEPDSASATVPLTDSLVMAPTPAVLPLATVPSNVSPSSPLPSISSVAV
mmetsp:Transcript_27030/g.50531  ORF Transcript_27030/g.50531 Transcript_27030/m.50531 type:complete len:470 (-) Transcript_27030:60-1469(-)